MSLSRESSLLQRTATTISSSPTPIADGLALLPTISAPWFHLDHPRKDVEQDAEVEELESDSEQTEETSAPDLTRGSDPFQMALWAKIGLLPPELRFSIYLYNALFPYKTVATPCSLICVNPDNKFTAYAFEFVD